jgi:coronin-1B/1C/6
MSVVRVSKYRHVFGTAAKPENAYTDLRANIAAFDTDYIKANTLFFTFPWQGGGGSLAVFKHTDTGKKSADTPTLSGHTGQIVDFAFNPFNEYILASGSTDTTTKIWSIPEEGLTQTITEPTVSLEGHMKKINNVLWHPTANNVLLTAGGDNKILLWDVERGKEQITVDNVFNDAIQSLAFNKNGNSLVVTSKDKKLRLLDVRSKDQVMTTETEGHQGTKGSRAIWLTGQDRIFTVGFTKMSERHFMIWDPRSMTKPIHTEDIDVSAGLIMPFYDEGTNLLFLAGKGDGNIRYYELTDSEPYIYHISDFKSTDPQRGMCMVPKLALDVHQCEVVRLLKLENKIVTPISFQVPRRSDLFQPDIYPDTPAPEPALTAEEYFNGETKEPIYVSMKPGENKYAGKANTFSAEKVEKKAPKPNLPKPASSPQELQKQNEELRKRVEELFQENYQLKNKLEALERQQE